MVSSGRPELVQVWVGAQGRVGPLLRWEEAQGFPLTSWPAQGETGPSGLLPAGRKGKVPTPAAFSHHLPSVASRPAHSHWSVHTWW